MRVKQRHVGSFAISVAGHGLIFLLLGATAISDLGGGLGGVSPTGVFYGVDLIDLADLPNSGYAQHYSLQGGTASASSGHAGSTGQTSPPKGSGVQPVTSRPQAKPAAQKVASQQVVPLRSSGNAKPSAAALQTSANVAPVAAANTVEASPLIPAPGQGTGHGLGSGSGSGFGSGSGPSAGSGDGEGAGGVPPSPLFGDGSAVVTNKPAPKYPKDVRGVSGVVKLNVQVAADGRVEKVTVVQTSGQSDLNRAAQQTLDRLWSFRPQGFPYEVTVTVTFRYDPQPSADVDVGEWRRT